MSTNDTVLLMGSGASGVTPGRDDFAAAVTEVCADLALQLLADAEGADARHRDQGGRRGQRRRRGRGRPRDRPQQPVQVRGLRPGSQLGTGPGRDRHHRRGFEPDRIDVAFNGVEVCRDGGIGEPRTLVDLSGREVTIVIDLHNGPAEATVWTNDLTYDYVHENAEYST